MKNVLIRSAEKMKAMSDQARVDTGRELDPHVSAAIYALAREACSTLPPPELTPDFASFWLRELLVPIRRMGMFSAHKGRADEWCGRLLMARGRGFYGQCAAVHDEILAVDCDDGWPADKVLNAIFSITVAADHGLRKQSRWLAEAGLVVWRLMVGTGNYNDVIAASQKGWLRHQFESCAVKFPLSARCDELERLAVAMAEGIRFGLDCNVWTNAIEARAAFTAYQCKRKGE